MKTRAEVTWRDLDEEAQHLDPGCAPWRVERQPLGQGPSGDNWLIATFGYSPLADEEEGQAWDYYVTTDHVHASEDYGDSKTDAEFIVWCRNHWGDISEALRLAAEAEARQEAWS